MALRQRRTSSELIDDAVGEILLRIPPDSSAYLVRSSTVCKFWRRIVSAPDFTRRYREFHRTPPLLGFVHNSDDGRLFYPTMIACPFPQPAPDCSRRWLTLDDDHQWWAVDCRHGRVLLWQLYTLKLLVCDPITGGREELPKPDIIPFVSYSAMLLCAAAGCDHCDCHGGPFLVVFVSIYDGSVSSCVYSSKAGAWGTPDSVDLGSGYHQLAPKRGAVVGDSTYFSLRKPSKILKYDLGKNLLSVISLPVGTCSWDPVPMAMEDGSLGFADFRYSRAYLWQRTVNPKGVARWVPLKFIELEEKLSIVGGDKTDLIGLAEGVGVLFVRVNTSTFMVELKSEQVRKVGEFGPFYKALPFMSFSTPDSVNSPLPAEKKITTPEPKYV